MTTKEEFDQIYTERGPIIAIFTAEGWCGPCNSLVQKIERMTKEFENIPVVFVNIDESPDLTEEWGVAGLPATLAIQKDGSVTGNVVGDRAYLVRKLFESLGN